MSDRKEILVIAVAAQGSNSRATIGPAGCGASFVAGPDDLPVVAGGGGYLGGGGGGGGYDGGGGSAVDDVGGSGGAGGSFVSSNALSSSFDTASARGRGSVVLTLLDNGLEGPSVTDWNALAARVTANFEATGQWYL
ncbi:hypothetical protein JMJ56_15370 [Belnapia sp. T18]|uniref:Uncharacterized protein n=1 Tax=Belnapia arida TaxID=2804533 RepID=A0ABS1U406_9PROT|nr:hypothetical protein [Belnapia arida]MBL6079398.1 hypothetical protein [Belnapia arida]